jgi:uncharacterized delta-60 repeat protein
VVTPVGSDANAASVAIQSDGGIVVAGSASGIGPVAGNVDFALVRYTAGGGVDTSFGGGVVTTDFGQREYASAVAIQADGKIVAVGATLDANNSGSFALARYNPDGSLDPSFDEDGKKVSGFGADDQALAMALQPDGKIVAAGFTNAQGTRDFALGRYLAD